jgi:PAS domain-containing protein
MDDITVKASVRFASEQALPHKYKHAFFSLFDSDKIYTDKRIRSSLALLWPVLYLLNMMSLIVPVHKFTEAQWFVTALSCIRYDGLAWSFGLESMVGVATALLVVSAACTAALLTHFEAAKVPRYDRFKSLSWYFLVQSQLTGFSEGFLVPTACMLISMVKYGLSPASPTEYISSATSDLSYLQATAGLVALPIFILEASIGIQTQFDVSFNNPGRQWFARAHSYVQHRVLLVVLTLCASQFAHDATSPELYLVLSGMCHSYLAYLYAAYLPYYNDMTNTFYISIYMYLVSCCAATLLSVKIGTPYVVILISAAMYPCYFAISYGIVCSRVRGTSEHNIEACKTHFEGITFLKSKLATFLANESSSERAQVAMQLRGEFNYIRNAFPTRMITGVWEALFYLIVDNNPELAQLKLCSLQGSSADYESRSKSATSTPSSLGVIKDFEGEFLMFHLSKHCDSTIKGEDVTYLVWLKQIEEVKQFDLELCEELVKIYGLLLASKSNVSAFSERLIPLYLLLLKTKATYKHLTQVYTKRPEVLELYGRFMCDVLNDQKGYPFLVNGQTERNSHSRVYMPINKIQTLFGADVGIIVISGAEEDLGIIQFVNEEAARLLSLSPQQMIGAELDRFIPPPYCHNHNTKLAEFLKYGTTNRIYRAHLTLYNPDRYDVEVTFDVRVMALNCRPYFLTAIRGKPENRELAIYDDDGKITSCTKNFEVLYAKGARLEGVALGDLFHGIMEERMKYPDNVPFMRVREESRLVMMFTHETLRLSKIKFLYIIRSDQALEELLEDRAIDPQHIPLVNAALEYLSGRSRRLGKKRLAFVAHLKRAGIARKGTEQGSQSRSSVDSHGFQSCDAQGSHDKAMTSLDPALSELRTSKFCSLRDSVLQRSHRIKLTLGLAFMIVFLIVTGLQVAVDNFTSDIVQISTIHDFSSRQLLSTKIATYSKTLKLIAEGASDSSLQETVSSLEDVIKELHRIEALVEEERKLGKDLGKNTILPIWKWEPDITQNLVTGREAVRQLLSHAEQLTAATTEKAVMYGIRNGIGETYEFFNQTLVRYVESEVISRRASINTIALLVFIGVVCILLAYIMILAPNIYFLDTTSRKVHLELQQVHAESIIHARSKIMERLEYVHGEQPMIPELEHSKVTKYRLIWPRLALKFGLFVSATLLMLAGSFLMFNAKLDELIISNPHYSVWAGTRSTAVQSAYFWSRELLIRQRTGGYGAEMSKYQYYYSVNERITNSTQTLQWAHRVLSYTSRTSGITESELAQGTINLMHSAYSSDIPELHYGIHSGLLEFVAQVHDFAAEPAEGSLKRIELLSGRLLTAMDELSAKHQADIDFDISEMHSHFLGLLMGYGVILAVLYLYYIHEIKHISLLIIATARLLHLMPEVKPPDFSEDK